MNETQKIIFNCGIIPVIKLDDSKDALPLCKALSDGGLNVAEVTFRTNAAEASIQQISEQMPEVFVGAGTVLTIEQAKQAISAGAKFIVSPGFNEKVVVYCLEQNVPVIPGTSCPTDIEKALEYGLDCVKFFPAEANGGIKALKAMAAPYGALKFMPTGGITPANVSEYLQFGNVIACGGTWMVKEEHIQAGKFDEITRLSKEAVAVLHGFKFVHMAINQDSKEEAMSLAGIFHTLFSTTPRETSLGAFAGDSIEIIGTGDKAYGTKGHIGFKVNNVARAIVYLEKMGYEVNEDSMKGTKEKPTFIYLKKELGGFAVHLLEN